MKRLLSRAYAMQRWISWNRDSVRRAAELSELFAWAAAYFIILAALLVSFLAGE